MNYLIINGHPNINSFTSQIAKTIQQNNLKENKQSELLNLCELKFNPVFEGFSDKTPLEDDIQSAQDSISKAQHIIIVSPIWWSTYPALLKGFFDKTLLPGFAFQYTKGKSIPVKLLKGKTAELFLLSDAPKWYRKFILGDPATKILKRDILGFCGIKVKRSTRIGSTSSLNKEQREKIISNIKIC